MLRTFIVAPGLLGMVLLLTTAVQGRWSPHLFSEELLGLVNLLPIALVFLLARLYVFSILMAECWLAVQWSYYLGPTAEFSLWTDDLGPDST